MWYGSGLLGVTSNKSVAIFSQCNVFTLDACCSLTVLQPLFTGPTTDQLWLLFSWITVPLKFSGRSPINFHSVIIINKHSSIEIVLQKMAATLHVYKMKSALELPLNVIPVNIDFVTSNSTTDVAGSIILDARLSNIWWFKCEAAFSTGYWTHYNKVFLKDSNLFHWFSITSRLMHTATALWQVAWIALFSGSPHVEEPRNEDMCRVHKPW